MSERVAFPRFLAGLQAGLAGALVMLGWLALTTLWARNSVWWFPNLMATTFGGDPALRSAFGRYSMSGLALHLLQFSVLGGFFAMAIPTRLSGSRFLLFGVVAGLGFYYFMYDFVWKQVNPLIPLYSPDRQVIVGHILYGMMLARTPQFSKATRALTE